AASISQTYPGWSHCYLRLLLQRRSFPVREERNMRKYRNGMRFRPLLAAVGLAIGLAGAVQQASSEEVKWTMATWGGGLWFEVGAKNFAHRVEQMTEGRVKIEVASPS